MNGFRSLGCEVVLPDGMPLDGVRALFESRDRRFSRFHESSELNRVNAVPRGLMLVSEEFASMVSLSIDAARATGGLVTPAVGGALLIESVSLRGLALLRTEPVILDLDGVVKGQTVDDALELLGDGWVSAGGDVATTVPLAVGLPGGDVITLERGGLATSSVGIDPATGLPSSTPWRDVTVAAQSCYVADVAARAALLLGVDGPSWLERRRLPGRFVTHAGDVGVTEQWRRLVSRQAAA